jgi:hypothetical protein
VRRLDGDSRVMFIGYLQILCLARTVRDQAPGANTRISRRIQLITDMRFLIPVVPSDPMGIGVQILKIAGDIALVEEVVTVGGDHCRPRQARSETLSLGSFVPILPSIRQHDISQKGHVLRSREVAMPLQPRPLQYVDFKVRTRRSRKPLRRRAI